MANLNGWYQTQANNPARGGGGGQMSPELRAQLEQIMMGQLGQASNESALRPGGGSYRGFAMPENMLSTPLTAREQENMQRYGRRLAPWQAGGQSSFDASMEAMYGRPAPVQNQAINQGRTANREAFMDQASQAAQGIGLDALQQLADQQGAPPGMPTMPPPPQFNPPARPAVGDGGPSFGGPVPSASLGSSEGRRRLDYLLSPDSLGGGGRTAISGMDGQRLNALLGMANPSGGDLGGLNLNALLGLSPPQSIGGGGSSPSPIQTPPPQGSPSPSRFLPTNNRDEMLLRRRPTLPPRGGLARGGY